MKQIRTAQGLSTALESAPGPEYLLVTAAALRAWAASQPRDPEALVLQALRQCGAEGAKCAELASAAAVTRQWTAKILLRLRRDGRVAVTGGGQHTRYHLVRRGGDE